MVDALIGVISLVWLYHFGRVLVTVFFRLFTRWKVVGRDNVPRRGAVVVVANHLNFNDPPLLAVSLGRQVVFMAKEELFRFRLMAWFLGSLGSFPVHRGRPDRAAIRRSERVLSEGRALVLFPESTRSKDGQLQPAFPGSALFASRHGVPVLPVGIAGSEQLRGLGCIFRRPRITVNIGQPFTLPSSGGRLNRAELTEHTELIMRRIAELLPPQYRGVYGDGGKR